MFLQGRSVLLFSQCLLSLLFFESVRGASSSANYRHTVADIERDADSQPDGNGHSSAFTNPKPDCGARDSISLSVGK